ncbi:MAG TPA: hypothetical protein PKA64_22975, partial [Myxococcota bacterium]|nr:hypothetical protein [Myxococcota bacterium]
MTFQVVPSSVPDSSVLILGGIVQVGVTQHAVATTRLELARPAGWRVDRVVVTPGSLGWSATIRQGAEGDAAGGALLAGDIAVARVLVRADSPFIKDEAITPELALLVPEPAAAAGGVISRTVVTAWNAARSFDVTVTSGVTRTYRALTFDTQGDLVIGCAPSAEGFVAPADGVYAIHASVGMERVDPNGAKPRVARCQLRALALDGTERDLAFSNAQADSGVAAVAVCHDLARLAAGETVLVYASADATLVVTPALSGGPL